jgi:hypothetical protein
LIVENVLSHNIVQIPTIKLKVSTRESRVWTRKHCIELYRISAFAQNSLIFKYHIGFYLRELPGDKSGRGQDEVPFGGLCDGNQRSPRLGDRGASTQCASQQPESAATVNVTRWKSLLPNDGNHLAGQMRSVPSWNPTKAVSPGSSSGGDTTPDFSLNEFVESPLSGLLCLMEAFLADAGMSLGSSEEDLPDASYLKNRPECRSQM